MKVIEAVSCKQLFWKSVLAAVIVNVFCYIITFFGTANFSFPGDSGFTILLVAYILQLSLCFILGLVIRRKNRALLFREEIAKGKYSRIAFWGLVASMIVFFNPDIIMVPYMFLTAVVYHTIGLDRIVTSIDFMSIFICLGLVFFFRVRGSGIDEA